MDALPIRQWNAESGCFDSLEPGGSPQCPAEWKAAIRQEDRERVARALARALNSGKPSNLRYGGNLPLFYLSAIRARPTAFHPHGGAQNALLR